MASSEPTTLGATIVMNVRAQRALLIAASSAMLCACSAGRPLATNGLLPQSDGELPARHALTFTKLENLCGKYACPRGGQPESGVTIGPDGNLYGTTLQGGGTGRAGVVYQISRDTEGKPRYTVIYAFSGPDGAYPTAPVVFDASGNIYGTAWHGGNGACNSSLGCGTVFELSPASNGTWHESTLYSFNGSDGEDPFAGVILDSHGNLYGTDEAGGNPSCLYGSFSGCGTVFRLTRDTSGKWKLTTLFEFNGTDGADPAAGVVFDRAGNLYGTTVQGGKTGPGTVYELSPRSRGAWKHTTLYTFTEKSPNGAYPAATPIFDAAGVLYATTTAGGNPACLNGVGCGTVFSLTNAHERWTLRTLFRFNGRNGYDPSAALTFDGSGNLYGTTFQGGAHSDGTAFELMQQSGKFTYAPLLDFECHQGADPTSALVFDASGDLYGTAEAGGSYGCPKSGPIVGAGTVFELSTEYRTNT